MGFPPRCSFYTVKTSKVPEVVERHQIRLVRKCCPGFAENLRRDACVPCKKCYEGTCGKDGKCLCNSGFRGEHCADACEPMRWGVDCQRECLCEHGGCNPRTGKCDCPTGWFGTRCEVPCLEGFYGKHCISRCRCGERDRCSPETGECLTKSPRQQEHHSTRAIHYMTEDILNLTIALNKQRSTPSLKKYYTFDMELDSSNSTEGKNEITNRSRYKIHNENSAGKYYGNTMKSAEESVESTTEMSSEVIRKIENVEIIGENGSLENHDENNSEKKSQEIVDNKFESKENFLNELKISKDKTDHEAPLVSAKVGEMPNEIDVSKINHKKDYQETHYRNQKNLKTKPFHSTSNANTHNSQIENHKSSTKTQGIFSDIPKISSETTSTSTIAKNETTIHEVEEIIPPTTFKTNAVTTSSPKESEILNSRNIEEDELQNLDITNNLLLTIRETSTQSSSISTTVGYITLVEKGLLPFDVLSSTKSIDLRNDLLTTEHSKNQVLMEAYERRNFNGQIGQEASQEFEYSTNKSNITTHMAIVALVSFILVLVLSVIIMVHHYTRKKRRKATSIKIDNQNFGGHSVAVYTHSIFHTPLPDPPLFENPVFKTPVDTTSDHRTIQTHVIYSLNLPENKINDAKEYTYDHPPSTGSYRAASIPEPPEMFESLRAEPVYDEIPSSRRENQTLSPPPSYKSSCLYMNTCGKTRF